MPIESCILFSKELIARQNENIQSKFGKEIRSFLDNLERECACHVNSFKESPAYTGKVDIPLKKFDLSNLNLHELNNGLTQNMDFKSTGLILGDIEQYSSPISNYSIASGATGVILSVLKDPNTSSTIKCKIKDWLISNLNEIKNIQNPNVGMFNGLSDVCTILYNNGLPKDADELLLKINNNLSDLNVSMYSGLSGIGLIDLSMYANTGKSIYKNFVNTICFKIIDKVKNHDFEVQSDSEEKIGLITGWTGAALFLWKAGMVLEKSQFKDYSLIILNKIVDTDLVYDQQGVSFKDDSRGMRRVIPYLDTGSVGIALTLLEIQIDDPVILGSKLTVILNQLIKANDSFCSYMSCLFSGVDGLITLSNAVNKIYKTSNSRDILNSYIESLNNYAVSTNFDNILFPGKLGYKCSMDLSTGSAGIMMTLLDVKSENEWGSWIPLINNDVLNVFNSKQTKIYKES